MIDRDTCTLYELYAARWNGGDPTAGSGAIFDLADNALRPAGWTSADAAGLPIYAGLLRYDEVAAGVVDHAIRVTAACTYDAYLWPARHAAGTNDRRCPPMGARFRLKAGFDASRFGRAARVVIRAMKHYGLIVADNGSDWYFQGTVDPAVDQPPSSTSSSGSPPRRSSAVDERACRVAPNSGAFADGPRLSGARRRVSRPARGSSRRSGVPRASGCSRGGTARRNAGARGAACAITSPSSVHAVSSSSVGQVVALDDQRVVAPRLERHADALEDAPRPRGRRATPCRASASVRSTVPPASSPIAWWPRHTPSTGVVVRQQLEQLGEAPRVARVPRARATGPRRRASARTSASAGFSSDFTTVVERPRLSISWTRL